MLKKGVFLAAGFLAFAVGAKAQVPVIQGDFIFFVDGTNIQVPSVAGGTVVDDPANAANKIMKFAGGSWAENGFEWPVATGADMTAFTGTNYGESDTLFLKINVDPANADKNVILQFFDKTNGNIIGTNDLPFRMGWYVPVWAKDGKWHSLAIPLPPRTFAQLAAAKEGKKADGSPLGVTVDSLFKNWSYGGAWGNGAGVFDGPANPNFQEWQWDAVWKVGFHYDFDGAFGPIYVDDFYIGGKKTDLTVATSAPEAVPAATVSFNGTQNSISWTNSSNASAYLVYYSDKAFTSVTDAGVTLLGKYTQGPVTHSPRAPHPSLGKNATSYYAVTTISNFGKENPSITNSYKTVVGDLASTPWMQEVSEAVANGILDDLDAKIVSNARFPAGLPSFKITPANRATEGTAPADEADLSAETWSVYFESPTSGTYVILYAEVKDQVRQWTNASELSQTWNFDSIEMTLGGYPVTSFSTGSTHATMQRGAEPDYQFRFGKFKDQAAGFVYENFRFAAIAPNSQCLVDSLRDASNNVIGYKLLAAINIEALQGGTGADALVDLPNGTDLKLMPFNFAINDADGNAREAQVTWSYKPNVTNSWWNSPGQWPAVAFAGKDIAITSSSEELNAGRIDRLELFQNYPNPFNPSTSIKFNVPAAGNVSLEVFNMLGQKVAVLVNGRVSAGSHNVNFDASSLASGMYLYRLTSGGQSMTRKLMLLK